MAIATKGWVIDLLKKFNKKKDVYSTDEQRIGTWIDGKPIYKKTWINTNISTLNENQSHDIFSIPEVDAIVKRDVIFVCNNNTTCELPGYYRKTDSGAFNIYPIKNLAYIDKIIVTLEYTKTTD